MISNNEIDLYVDAMIIDILSSDSLHKTAQTDVVSGLISSISNYFSNHIDPEDKAGSILNLLAPGAISLLFSSMNMPWIGRFLGLAAAVFHIDVSSILSSVYNSIKSFVTQNKNLNSNQVQSIVDEAVQQHTQPINEEEEIPSNAVTSSDRLKDARFLKLAMIAYDAEDTFLTKTAKPFNWGRVSSKQGKAATILSRIVGFIFKIGLASAGFMVAGDVINKLVGRPNALDNTIQRGKPIETTETQEISAPVSAQTKFKVKPNYTDIKYNVGNNWIERVPNTQNGIESMVISFAKEVYDGLDSLDNKIKSSNNFKKIVNSIYWYNHISAGDPIVFLPKEFTSKKQLVDHFIDEVAA